MDNVLKTSVPCLLITVAALYVIGRRKLAGNRINFCKGHEMGSSSKQLRQAPESTHEIDFEEEDEFVKEVDDTCEKSCNIYILVDKASSLNDRLSELPDDILSHIITYMSLRDVARVATLSKNWRKVSLSLRCLDLDWRIMSSCPYIVGRHICEPYRQAYLNGVDQVLQIYKDQNNIESFRLESYCLDNNHAAVNQWMGFASKKKECLQSLTIQYICTWDEMSEVTHIRCAEAHVISGSFLSQFSLLKNLHLECCIVRLDNDLRLSNLTSLDLCQVIIEGAQWQRFLSSLSSVEFLTLTCCNLPKKLCIDDRLSRLISLKIDFCRVRKLELSAGNLKTFIFCFFRRVECSFSCVSSLENVDMFYGPYYDAAGVILKSLAAKAFNLKTLIAKGTYSLGLGLPSCQGLLSCSVLNVRLFSRLDNYNYNYMKLVPHLLKSFPLLKKLEIQFPQQPDRLIYGDPIPYLHNNLKEIKLSVFHPRWIPVATFLLQCATELNCMVLTKSMDKNHFLPNNKLSEKECEIVCNALVGKASSPHVEVIIEDKLVYLSTLRSKLTATCGQKFPLHFGKILQSIWDRWSNF